MLIFQREFSIGFIWLKWNKTPELYITYSIFLCVCVCVLGHSSRWDGGPGPAPGLVWRLQPGREQRVWADSPVRYRGAVHHVCCSPAPAQYPAPTSVCLRVCMHVLAALVPSPAVRHPRRRVRLQERAVWRLRFSPGRFLCRLTSDRERIQGLCLSLVSFYVCLPIVFYLCVLGQCEWLHCSFVVMLMGQKSDTAAG